MNLNNKKKKIAKKLFSSIISKGFEHDIELALILKKNNIKIVELPITWTHKKFKTHKSQKKSGKGSGSKNWN